MSVINSFSLEGRLLIQSCEHVLRTLFPKSNEQILEKLTIVTPHPIIDYYTFRNDMWEDIYMAWQKIYFSKNSSSINEWRLIYKYGFEVIPGLKIFKIRNDNDLSYFFLLNAVEPKDFSVFNDFLFVFRAWLHVKNKKGFFHGAGIVKQKRAYLFLGPSGAGKSTVSAFSSEHGHQVIHDDHVVVSKAENGKYLLSDIAFKNPGISLKAFFFLVQDKSDKLLPLSQAQTAQGLFKSLFELPSEKVLYGSYLINAFNVCADIARAVPGYELHFTKSPNFWKIIEDEKAL